MVQLHTSPPRPRKPQQNCLQPSLPYRTSRTDWNRLDTGFFIGAGVLFAAGLYEYQKAVQTPSAQPLEPVSPVKGVCYIRPDLSLEPGLGQALLPSETPAGVLQRSVDNPTWLNDDDKKVAGNESKKEQEDQRGCGLSSGPAVGSGEATTAEKKCKCPHEVSDETEKKKAGNETDIEQEDQRVPTQSSGPAFGKTCSCPRKVSDETPTAAGPVQMGNKTLSTADDVDQAHIDSSKMPDGTVSTGDGGNARKVFEGTADEGSESPSVDFESPQQSLVGTEGRAGGNGAESSEGDVTGCVDDQGLATELPTSSPEIGNQKSPSAPPPGDKGHVSEGTAEKDHGFCEDEGTSDVDSNISDVTNTADVTNSASYVNINTSNVSNNTCDRPDLPEPDVEDLADGEGTEDDALSSSEEKCPRHADFTAAEVITVTACPVHHELSVGVTGSETQATEKADTEISAEEFLSEGNVTSESESGSLPPNVPVSPRLQKKLRCAVLYADWRENSDFCHPNDVMPNDILKVHFSWLGDGDDCDLDDVSEVKVHCAVLEGVWREDGGLVENHVTDATGGDDDMAAYYPGHGRRNGSRRGNEMWL